MVPGGAVGGLASIAASGMPGVEEYTGGAAANAPTGCTMTAWAVGGLASIAASEPARGGGEYAGGAAANASTGCPTTAWAAANAPTGCPTTACFFRFFRWLGGGLCTKPGQASAV